MTSKLTLLSLLVLACTTGCTHGATDTSPVGKPEDHAVRVGLDPHRMQPVPPERVRAHLPRR